MIDKEKMKFQICVMYYYKFKISSSSKTSTCILAKEVVEIITSLEQIQRSCNNCL